MFTLDISRNLVKDTLLTANSNTLCLKIYAYIIIHLGGIKWYFVKRFSPNSVQVCQLNMHFCISPGYTMSQGKDNARLKSYKNKSLNTDEMRRRREEEGLQLRKQKKDEQVSQVWRESFKPHRHCTSVLTRIIRYNKGVVSTSYRASALKHC